MIDRRHGLLFMATTAVAPVLAQITARPVRIGWVSSSPIRSWPPFAHFTAGMRELGWTEGTGYVVDEAAYEGRPERIPKLIGDLVQRKPDLMIVGGSPPMRAAMAATSTIPVVMLTVGDPVGQGFVASLARPGGNVTGTTAFDHAMLAKQFELLLQAVPLARRIGVVHNPDIAPHVNGLRDVEVAARRASVELRPVAMRTPVEIDPTVESLRRERVDAVHWFLQAFLNNPANYERVAALSLQHRWPTVLADLPHVRAGILLAYGSKQEDAARRVAYYVDRIVKGTPPAELPVEEPTRLYVSVNLKTARALGITLPQAVLLRADEVVE